MSGGDERPRKDDRRREISGQPSQPPGDFQKGGRRPGGSGGPPGEGPPDDDDDFGPNIFDEEPESDHESDTDDMRRTKREARRKHRAQLNKLRYQANFVKEDPPFKYNGEVQASTFKRWCREIRGWVRRGCLSDQAGIEMSGKYLGGRAYHFFERDILDLKRRYSLMEYFEYMFDYLFPPDFRMQQCDKFDIFEQ